MESDRLDFDSDDLDGVEIEQRDGRIEVDAGGLSVETGTDEDVDIEVTDGVRIRIG